MIRIKRPPAPEFLLDKEGNWMKEIQKAIEHYTQPNWEKSFEFQYYNNEKLKAELIKVFGAKCAYCESSYGAVYDGDVEHFRPKGQVSGKVPERPGYFWLANDWDNLLLSCQHCNQRRKHLLEGGDKEVAGKLDKFPLKDETKRASYGKDLTEEEKVRLLINPCMDNPEEHFEYDRKEGVVRGKTEMGKTSIKVYVLQRVKLVKERKNILDQLLFQMCSTRDALERYNNDTTQINKEALDKQLDFLMSFTKPDRPYAGMCRYFVREFLKENGLK